MAPPSIAHNQLCLLYEAPHMASPPRRFALNVRLSIHGFPEGRVDQSLARRSRQSEFLVLAQNGLWTVPYDSFGVNQVSFLNFSILTMAPCSGPNCSVLHKHARASTRAPVAQRFRCLGSRRE